MKTALSKRPSQYVIILASLLALLVIYNQFIGGSPGGYTYRVPEQTDDGWETASLADVGMDETPITDLMNALSSLDEHPIHSIVVVKDGRLVLEEYFSGEDLELSSGLDFAHRDFDRDTLHCQASASKTVTSILLG